MAKVQFFRFDSLNIFIPAHLATRSDGSLFKQTWLDQFSIYLAVCVWDLDDQEGRDYAEGVAWSVRVSERTVEKVVRLGVGVSLAQLGVPGGAGQHRIIEFCN